MTNYTKTTDFAAKDALPSGNSAKIVKGSEIDTEFNNIATASATKANANSAALTGTTTFETISDGTIAITAFVDEDNMASDSATLLPTQQSVKAYVDSQVTAQDLDVTDGSTSIDIDLDSESLGILGGTGIDSTASGTGVTLAIDSTVATLTGSQTLSNKTLSAPVVSGNLTTDGLLDGRDVAADGTKLDGIESGATADQTAAEIKTAYESNANTNAFTDADESKLDGIEASADVTDTANVTAAGALMDSELTDIAAVKALDQGVATTDSPTFAGLTTTADVSFGDDDKAVFGAGSDLQIYHDGSNSYISDQGTGNLRILAEDFRVVNAANSETMIQANVDGDVRLYHDADLKLATTSTGIDVTGVITTDGMTTSADINFGDNDKAVFGAGSDLQIYHDGSQSVIYEGGTGPLDIRSNSETFIKNGGGTETLAHFANNGAVTLYHDNAEKLATASTGIDVTGTVTTDGLTVDGSATIQASSSPALIVKDTTNNAEARLQAFNSSATVGTQSNHSFSIETNDTTRALFANNGDVSLYEDTGTTPKFFWDASAESLGIGTSSPDTQLEVSNAASAVLRLSTSDTSVAENQELGALEYSQADISGAGGGVKASIRAKADNSTAAQTYLAFHTSDSSANDVERMRIDSAGQVGIGTTSPSTALHVVDTTGDMLTLEANSASSSPNIVFKNNDGEKARINSVDAGELFFGTGASGTERMRIDSSGQVGIGTASPDTTLTVIGAGVAEFRVGNIGPSSNSAIRISRKDTTVSGGNPLGYLEFGGNDSTGNVDMAFAYVGAEADASHSAGSNATALTFGVTATGSEVPVERARLDKDGDLLVGKTATAVSSEGIEVRNDGLFVATRDSNKAAILNRKTTNGDILEFNKDSVPIGSIGSNGSLPYFAGTSIGLKISATQIRPSDSTGANNDNAVDLGKSDTRFQDIYATNGTIQTSDRNEKQDIEALSDAEQRVAVAAKGLLRKFRWKDSVAEKGDDARIHFGIIAQDLQAAFEAEGLDAGRYAMFINSTWTDEETGEERSRMGVRYSELLAFIIAAI